MHVIQYVATKADDVESAHRQVKSYLEEQLGSGDTYTTWYDWFVTGGGRWASNENAQYDDNYTADVAHQDTPKFQECLDKAKEFRQQALNEYIAEARKVDVDKIISDIETSAGEDFRSAMELYSLHKLYDMSIGKWDYNSYYFDIIHDSSNMIHLKNCLDKGDKDWYLVPVDFHF